MSAAALDPRDRRIAELEARVAEQATIIAEQAVPVAEKAAAIERLEQLVGELRARLGTNSRNSSKPPSQDPKPRRTQTPSKRTRGGQPGHEGARRTLFDNPDEVFPLFPSQCNCCGKRLRGDDLEPVREQVRRLPALRPHLTEFQLHARTCSCGATTRAPLPPEIRGGYGPRLCALVAHLTGALRLSKRATSQLMLDLLGVPMAEGTVCKVEQRVTAALEPAHTEAIEVVRAADVVHADEAGWRENKKRAWLWLFATLTVSLFVIARSRGRGVVADVLRAPFGGVLVSDRWGPYTYVAANRRQPCWAHLLRDFTWMLERSSMVDRTHTEALQRHVGEIFERWHRLKNGEVTRRGFQRCSAGLHAAVEEERAWIEGFGSKGIAGKAREIRKLRAALWTFAEVEGVEPTNNHGEQQLRHAAIWRKCSYETDVATGSRYVERVQTVVQTPASRDVIPRRSSLLTSTPGFMTAPRRDSWERESGHGPVNGYSP